MRNKAFDNLIKALCLALTLAMVIGLAACESGSAPNANVQSGGSNSAALNGEPASGSGGSGKTGTGENASNGQTANSDPNTNGSGTDTNEADSQTGIESILEFNDGPQVTIETADAKYELKKGLKTYLFIGIDDPRTVAEQIATTRYHLCDTLILYVVDDANKTYSTLPISRDTVVTVDNLDPYGNLTAQVSEQIAYAYAYTIDPNLNSENVVRAVSRLLGGISVDGYITLSYSALPAINDALGGVTVKIEDDLTKSGLDYKEGDTVTLKGDEVEKYLRARINAGEGKNSDRMRRQQTYMNAFKSELRTKMKESSGIINDLYNAASPYLTTNIGSGTLTNTAARCINYSNYTYSLSGTTESVTYATGKTHAEMTLDQQSVDTTVLKLFYTKIQ